MSTVHVASGVVTQDTTMLPACVARQHLCLFIVHQGVGKWREKHRDLEVYKTPLLIDDESTALGVILRSEPQCTLTNQTPPITTGRVRTSIPSSDMTVSWLESFYRLRQHLFIWKNSPTCILSG
jgi:hypothetical protein